MIKLEELLNKGFYLCIDILIAFIVLVVGLKLISILNKVLKKHHKIERLDPIVKSFTISGITICLKILLVVGVISIVGFPTTSLITIIGSCGVTIGLALQGGLSNLAGGIIILLLKPCKEGDYIESNGKEGKVKNINIFYTTITTYDNKNIELPNGTLSNSNITNYTANPERRLDLEFEVDYNTKIDKVKKVIKEVIDNEELILKDEPVTIRLLKHGSSSLVFAVNVWTKTENYYDVLFNLEENIKETFDKNKIEIPYSQLDVHLKNK